MEQENRIQVKVTCEECKKRSLPIVEYFSIISCCHCDSNDLTFEIDTLEELKSILIKTGQLMYFSDAKIEEFLNPIQKCMEVAITNKKLWRDIQSNYDAITDLTPKKEISSIRRGMNKQYLKYHQSLADLYALADNFENIVLRRTVRLLIFRQTAKY